MLDPTYFFPSFAAGTLLASDDPPAEAALSPAAKDDSPTEREEEAETPVTTSLWRSFQLPRSADPPPPPPPPAPTHPAPLPSPSPVPPHYVTFLEALLGRPLVPASRPGVEAKRQLPAPALPAPPDELPAPAAPPHAPANPAPPTPRHRSSKRRRRRNRRRSSGGGGDAGAGAGAGGDVPAAHEALGEAVKVDSSALPDDVLLRTFRTVMATGLPVVVRAPADAPPRPAKHASLSVDSEGVLRWGRGKHDRLRLSELTSVDDVEGTLDLALAAASGPSVRVGASSHMEKALLLRCFGLLLAKCPSGRWWLDGCAAAADEDEVAA